VKVNFDLRNNGENIKNNVAFKGFKPVKDEFGNLALEFNYPYDSTKYDCYLEVCTLDKDDHNNYFVNEGVKCKNTPDGFYKLSPHKNIINMSDAFGLMDGEDFAYHYALVPKGADRNDPNTHPVYKIDAGAYIDSSDKRGKHEIYNIVAGNSVRTLSSGSMKLLMPDFYNPMWTYDKQGKIVGNPEIKEIRKMTKTFSNHVGGSLAGIEKDVRDGKFDGYDRIISTPIFTDDSLSGHGYWNKNCMQMVHKFGNINNYTSLQREMFKKGINFVSDGAFVNEGLEGIHFKHVLKWGEQSPYFEWFNASNLKSGPFTLGVLPKKRDFVSHKLVNAPFTCTQDPKTGIVTVKENKKHTNKQPVYFQVFDNRLVNDETKKDPQKLIRTYDKRDTGNPLDINTHNDTVIPYSFEIKPETYLKNIKLLNEYNKNHPSDIISLDSYMGTRFVGKFENFEIEEKIEGKFENWDANTDIAKLHFVLSNKDIERITLDFPANKRDEQIAELERKTKEVQDYVVTSGKYWTDKTSKIHNLYVAQQLKGITPQNPKLISAKIHALIHEGKLPKKLANEINPEIISNVFDGSYNLKGGTSDMEYKNTLLANLMELPLDTIEFGDNLTSVLASPYISKRATTDETIGASRFEMYSDGNPHLTQKYLSTYSQMDRIYKNELSNFAKEVIKNTNALIQPHWIAEGYNTSTFGNYVLPMISETITKYAIVKALAPDTKVTVNSDTGELLYDYDALKNVTLESLGIQASSPEDEAKQVLNKLQTGLNKLNDDDIRFLATAIYQTLQGTNETSFQLAEVIVDRLNAGLEWRIDATKDIADMDGLRDNSDTLDKTWKQVTNFWKKFSDGIYEKNPNSYIVAEITDEDSLFSIAGADSAKYGSGKDMVKKFLQETGMTGTANYSYYFSSILNMFAKHFDSFGRFDHDGFNSDVSERMRKKSLGTNEETGFFEFMPYTSIINSYNFIGNHDKPRTLHGLIVNTDWYNVNLEDPQQRDFRETAYRILNGIFIGPTINNSGDYKRSLDYVLKKADFSHTNTKALAMAESLQKGFEKAIRKTYPYESVPAVNEKISTAIYKSLADLANGTYLDKNFSAEGFGVKPVETAIHIIINQAVQKHGLNLQPKELQALKNDTIEAVLSPALDKITAMMEVLSVMPGVPTLYSGDDMGATGYESTTKNMYLQNRSYTRQEWISGKNEKYDFIKKHYDKINNIMKMRSRPELSAMNDGAPFMLPLQYAKTLDNSRGMTMSAILRQGTDGSVVISLINTAGVNQKFDGEYKPTPMKLERIEISDTNDFNPRGLTRGLTSDTILYNAKNEKDTYMVKEYQGKHFIKRVELNEKGEITKEMDTVIDGTTLTLHSKRKPKVLFNNQYHTGPIKHRKINPEEISQNLVYLNA